MLLRENAQNSIGMRVRLQTGVAVGVCLCVECGTRVDRHVQEKGDKVLEVLFTHDF